MSDDIVIIRNTDAYQVAFLATPDGDDVLILGSVDGLAPEVDVVPEAVATPEVTIDEAADVAGA